MSYLQVLASGGGGSTNSFTIMQPDHGTSPTAASSSDTLTYTSSDNSIYITGNSTSKSLNFQASGQEYSAGNSSTAQTINWANGPAQVSTLTGNVTYTFSNPVAGAAYVLRVNTGAGSFTATWPAAVKWSGGTAPTITATASKNDIINFYFDGTSYYGSYSQGY